MEQSEAPWLKFGTKLDKLLEIMDLGNLQQALQAVTGMFNDPFDQVDVEVLLRLYNKEFGSDPLPPIDLFGKPGNQYPFYINYQGNPITGLLSMTVSGKLDKVTIIEGEIGVFEGKTTKQAIGPKATYWKKLDMDPQIAAYVWGLSKELGKPVNWVWYQVLRRPTPEANTAFKRTRTLKGILTPFSLDEYKERVFDLLEKPLDDKPMVARKKLFISEDRKEEWVTEHALNWQEIQAKKEKQALLEQQGLPPEFAWPRNHLGCDMYGGCPFWDSCIGKGSIEGSNRFVKRYNK